MAKSASTNPQDDPIRVLIVDDHALFGRPQMVLEGERTSTSWRGVDWSRGDRAAENTTPDVVLREREDAQAIGIERPGRSRTRSVDQDPDAHDLGRRARPLRGHQGGGIRLLLKEISSKRSRGPSGGLSAANRWISPPWPSKLLNEFATMVKRRDERSQVPGPRLTERELEVLKLVAKGMNNRDIGAELFISENTVKNHVRNILEKLHLHSRMEAVVYAVREKLLDIK